MAKLSLMSQEEDREANLFIALIVVLMNCYAYLHAVSLRLVCALSMKGAEYFNAAEDAMELPTKVEAHSYCITWGVGKLLFPVYGGKKKTTPAGFEPALP